MNLIQYAWYSCYSNDLINKELFARITNNYPRLISNNIKDFILTFKDKIDINLQHDDENTILHLFADKNNLEAIKFLVGEFKDKIDINLQTKYGSTILDLFASENNFESIKFLIDEFKDKININLQNKWENTILHLFAHHNNFEAIKFLVGEFKDKININLQNKWERTILHLFAHDNNFEAIKFLVGEFKDKTDINAYNTDNYTILHLFAHHNNLEAIKFLVGEFKDKIDISNYSYHELKSLIIAIKIILHLGADLKTIFQNNFKKIYIINFSLKDTVNDIILAYKNLNIPVSLEKIIDDLQSNLSKNNYLPKDLTLADIYNNLNNTQINFTDEKKSYFVLMNNLSEYVDKLLLARFEGIFKGIFENFSIKTIKKLNNKKKLVEKEVAIPELPCEMIALYFFENLKKEHPNNYYQPCFSYIHKLSVNKNIHSWSKTEEQRRISIYKNNSEKSFF